MPSNAFILYLQSLVLLWQLLAQWFEVLSHVFKSFFFLFLHMIKNVSFVPFQKDVFQLKDIEKIAPKTKGISEYRQQLFSGNVFFA